MSRKTAKLRYISGLIYRTCKRLFLLGSKIIQFFRINWTPAPALERTSHPLAAGDFCSV
jgi:hypothetical protein